MSWSRTPSFACSGTNRTSDRVICRSAQRCEGSLGYSQLTAVTCSVVLLVAATACESDRAGDPGVSEGRARQPETGYRLRLQRGLRNQTRGGGRHMSAIRTWVDDRPSTRWSRSGTTFTAMEVRLGSTRHGTSPTGGLRTPAFRSSLHSAHDVEPAANGGPVMDLFDMPNRWYERRVGPVDVFVLDSNDLEEESQMEWLSTALASSSAPWQVLVFHDPVYSCRKAWHHP